MAHLFQFISEARKQSILKNAKNILVVGSLLMVVSSCSLHEAPQNSSSGGVAVNTQESSGANTSAVNPNGAIAAGEIESSDVSTVKPVLSSTYTYLDSEKKTYESATFGELIKPFKYTVVYFYPKDGTPNCTIQALDFSSRKQIFESYGVQILGVSKDDLDSHREFAKRNELTIKLLQDKSGDLLGQFGALGPLQEYGNGKELSDILRSTFIIDSEGKPVRAFKDVQAMGHADRVLSVVKNLPR